MRSPRDNLAFPPKRRRSVRFNTTLSVSPDEIAKAAEELAKLAPDEGEITFRIKAEVRIKRGQERETLNLQVHWSVDAIEAKR